MNRPVLLSGRMPEAAGECVVHVMGHGSPVELGTQLTLPEETEGVSGQVFTVVGTVQDPLHFPPIPRAAPWAMASWTASCLCRRAL